MPTKTARVIRHIHFEDLGILHNLLLANDYDVIYIDAWSEKITKHHNQATDLLIILGGPIGVDDRVDYPFLEHELVWARQRIQDDLPTLGICLGAQVLGVAAGGQVIKSSAVEIGWHPLQAIANVNPLFDALNIADTRYFHWHGQEVVLPDNVAPQLRSLHCNNQAFMLSNNVLGLQFHPEITKKGLNAWYLGHAHELQTENINLSGLRQDAEQYAESSQACAEHFFDAWLSSIDISH